MRLDRRDVEMCNRTDRPGISSGVRLPLLSRRAHPRLIVESYFQRVDRGSENTGAIRTAELYGGGRGAGFSFTRAEWFAEKGIRLAETVRHGINRTRDGDRQPA